MAQGVRTYLFIAITWLYWSFFNEKVSVTAWFTWRSWYSLSKKALRNFKKFSIVFSCFNMWDWFIANWRCTPCRGDASNLLRKNGECLLEEEIAAGQAAKWWLKTSWICCLGSLLCLLREHLHKCLWKSYATTALNCICFVKCYCIKC